MVSKENEPTLSSISASNVEGVERPRLSSRLISTVEPTMNGPFWTAPSTNTEDAGAGVRCAGRRRSATATASATAGQCEHRQQAHDSCRQHERILVRSPFLYLFDGQKGTPTFIPDHENTHNAAAT